MIKNFIKKINLSILFWAEGSKKIDFAVGGQAVIEGVMMRSPNHIAIAVRKPSGSIKVKKNPYKTLTQKIKFLNIPILRGVINLFEMMIIGTQAINFSATAALDEGEEKNVPKTKFEKVLEIGTLIFSFVFALGLSIILFKFIPLWLTTFFESRNIFIKNNYIIFNLIDGGLKMSIFLLYILLISLIPSFKRIFEYHGAEHKSIFTYENKLELTVNNAKKQTRFHPRCGTSFILIVFIVSILVYTLVPKQETFLINLLLRLAFLPLIAGISYEYLKISAKYADKLFAKILVTPGLLFQRLTTKEPDNKQLEVGLKSLEEILLLEKTQA